MAGWAAADVLALQPRKQQTFRHHPDPESASSVSTPLSIHLQTARTKCQKQKLDTIPRSQDRILRRSKDVCLGDPGAARTDTGCVLLLLTTRGQVADLKHSERKDHAPQPAAECRCERLDMQWAPGSFEPVHPPVRSWRVLRQHGMPRNLPSAHIAVH